MMLAAFSMTPSTLFLHELGVILAAQFLIRSALMILKGHMRTNLLSVRCLAADDALVAQIVALSCLKFWAVRLLHQSSESENAKFVPDFMGKMSRTSIKY